MNPAFCGVPLIRDEIGANVEVDGKTFKVAAKTFKRFFKEKILDKIDEKRQRISAF